MPYCLSPATVLRPEQQGALFFHRGSAETLELDMQGLAALLAWLQGKKPASLRAWFFRVYLARRGFVQAGTATGDIGRVRACLEQAAHQQSPQRALAAPEALHIAITSSCDQVCRGCFFSNLGNKQAVRHMDFALYCRIIDQAEKAQVFQIALGGGEPTVHPQLTDMVRYAAAQGLVPNLTTNGNQLDTTLASVLRQAGLGQLQLSLNGSTPASNARTRPNYPALEPAMAACRQAGLRWGLNVLVTRENLWDLENILTLAQGWGAWSVNLLRPKPAMVRPEKWLHENLPDATDNRRLQTLVQRWQRRGSFLLTTDASLVFLNQGSGETWRKNGIVGCTAGRKMLSINPDGQILPCSHLPLSDTGDGDFMQAWYTSEVLARFRALEETLEGECRQCELKAHCKGCRAIVLAQTQDFNGADQSCPKRQSMRSSPS